MKYLWMSLLIVIISLNFVDGAQAKKSKVSQVSKKSGKQEEDFDEVMKQFEKQNVNKEPKKKPIDKPKITKQILEAYNVIKDMIIDSRQIENSRLQKNIDFLKKDQLLDYKKEEDVSLLYLAVASKSIEIVKKLLENGANFDLKNKNGFTALIVAAEVGELDIVEKLLEKGADVNLKDNQGFTALMVAVQLKKIRYSSKIT
jgi:ankyrin repeat protein